MSSKSDKFKQPDRSLLIERLSSVSRKLSNETVLYQQAAAEQFGLNATDIKTGYILLESDPLTAGQIAKSSGLTTGAVTSVIDRLELAGFVRRGADPNDRRKVIVERIQSKAEEVHKVYQPMLSAMSRLNEQYTNQELALILDYLEAETEIFHNQAIKLRKRRKNKQR